MESRARDTGWRAALITVFFGALLAAQVSRPAAAQDQLRDRRLVARYQTVVDAYRASRTEAAIDDALRLEPAVYAAVDRAMVRARRGAVIDSTLDGAFFQAAAMLHTDAAFYCWRNGRDREASPQLDRARRLTDTSASQPGASASFPSDWYVAIVVVGSTLVVPEAALEYVADWVKARPDDVRLLTAAGWFAERLSTMAASPGSTLRAAQQRRRRYELSAERYFVEALRVEP